MGEQGRLGNEESGELGGDGTVGGAGGSKYCVWVRSPNGVADCESNSSWIKQRICLQRVWWTLAVLVEMRVARQ